MNGSATCLRPWPRGASDATSHSRRPTVNRPSFPRSSAPQAISRPASRSVELVGMPLRRLSSPRLSERWPASKAASSANARSTTGSPCGGRRPRTRAGSGDASVTVGSPAVHDEARTTVVFHWLALCLTSHRGRPHRCRQAERTLRPGRRIGRPRPLRSSGEGAQHHESIHDPDRPRAGRGRRPCVALAACGGGDSGGGGSSQSASDTLTFALRRRRRAERLRPAAVLAGPVPVLQRALRRRCSSPPRTARSSPAWSPSSRTTPRTPRPR